MRRHQCPTCTCADPDRVVVNVDAPFYALVIEMDQIFWNAWISRRRAARLANREQRSAAA